MCGVGLKHKSDYRRWAVLFNNTSPELNSDPTVETWIQNPLAMTKLYSDYQVILSDFFKSLTKTKHDDGITSTSPSMRTICFILTLMACNTSDYKYWALSKMICCTLYQFPIDYNSLTQSKWDESILSIVDVMWKHSQFHVKITETERLMKHARQNKSSHENLSLLIYMFQSTQHEVTKYIEYNLTDNILDTWQASKCNNQPPYNL